MKYKQLHSMKKFTDRGFKSDMLSNLLEARGVSDVERLMNLTEEEVLDPFSFANMKEAIKLLEKHIENKSNVKLLIDEDADGYTSASVMCNYLRKNAPQLTIIPVTNQKKTHGIVLKRLEPLDEFDLLIVPDAGSNDFKEIKELSDKGIDVLILDHHPSSHEAEGAVVVNPHLCDYENKQLSGVGVVYKLCQALDIHWNIQDADNYLDLVAVGMVADSMDLRSYETRYLVLEGIKMMNAMRENALEEKEPFGNPLIYAILDANKDYGIKKVNIKAIGWKIAPPINGCIRFGTDEEKMEMFKALIGHKELVDYQPRRKKKTDPKPDIIKVPFEKDVLRRMTNIKAKQDTNAKKQMKLINKQIEENELDKNKILIIDGTKLDLDKSLTGLIANKIAPLYMKPCLILKNKDDNTYGGSARNYSSMSVIEDLKQLLLDTKLFNTDMIDMGHPNAFGISLPKGNLQKAIEKTNDMLKDTEFELVYHCDYIIPVGRLKREDVVKVGNLSSIWGNGIPCPQFAITKIKMPVSEIHFQPFGKSHIIKFKKNNLSFSKKYAKEDEYNEMIMRDAKGFKSKKTAVKEVMLDIVCKFEVNEYKDRIYPEISIVDFNVSKIKELIF